jgi:predicted acetyltransferase
MLSNAEHRSDLIEVISATSEQEPVLANLLELYVHDFSEFHEIDLQSNGKFGYSDLPLYWREPGRHPFLIFVDGTLAGFALVKRVLGNSGPEPVWDMAEFFIVRGYRRTGIGRGAAHKVWKQLPGRWEVRVMEANRPALAFWQRAISKFAGSNVHPVRVEKNGQWWQQFSFDSPGNGPSQV